MKKLWKESDENSMIAMLATGKTNKQIMDEISEELKQLVIDVGCYIPLSHFGGKLEDIPHLIDETYAQTRVMSHSSWKLTEDELREIYTKAM